MNKEQAPEKEIIIKALEQGLAVCYDCSPKPDGVISHLRMAIKTYKEKFAGWESHEAQCPTGAVEGICVKRDASIKPPKAGTYYTNIGEIVWNEQKEQWVNFRAERQVKWWLDESSISAPQAVGPVWVKAEGFPLEMDKLYYLRHILNKSKKYIGRFVKTENLGIVLRLHSEQDHGLKRWDVELLDESPRQVFTREQVMEVCRNFFCAFENTAIISPEAQDHWMNANYPEPK